MLSHPRKKRKKKKNPRRAHLSASPSPSSLFCSAPRRPHASPSPASNLVRRATCRSSSRSVPPLHSSLRPSLSAHYRSRSPQTLAPFPTSIAVAAELPRRPDSPSPVNAASILRVGSFLASSSFDFAPNPAPSASLQGRRCSPPPAAAPARRTAPSQPLLACATAGEARRLLLIPVRAAPGPLRPRSAAPPSASPAACTRRARVRTQALGQGRPWP